MIFQRLVKILTLTRLRPPSLIRQARAFEQFDFLRTAEPDDLKRASRLPVSGRQRSLRCMLDWTMCTAVERVPGKVSGAWVFKGTRVPVQALFENLEGGATVNQFLEWFAGVTREQALTVLKFAESSLAVQMA